MKKVNELFTIGYRVLAGAICIVLVALAGWITGYSSPFDMICPVVGTIGVLSLSNALFSKVFKIKINYLPFLIAYLLGFMAIMYVLSLTESLGTLYTSLFCVIIAAILWIFNMIILTEKSPVVRILGGFVVNLVTIILVAIVIILIAGVSIVIEIL